MRISKLFYFILIVVCFRANAQFQEKIRYEKSIPSRSDVEFKILALKNSKVVVYGKINDRHVEPGGNKFFFTLLDSTLSQTATSDKFLPSEWEPFNIYTDSSSLYVLLFRNNFKNFYLISYHTETSIIENKTGEIPLKFTPSSFTVFGNNLFIVGSSKGKDVIIDYSFFDNTVRVVPSFFDTKYDIKNVEIDKQESIANILLEQTKKGNNSFFIRRLQSNGKQVSENKALFEDERYPTDLEMLILGREHYLIGLYGNGKNHYFSQGFLWGKYLPDIADSKASLKYVSFDEVQNFFEYLPTESRKKNERQKVINKINEAKHYNYKLRFLIQKPIVLENQIVLIAESYLISYQNNQNNLITYPYMQWGYPNMYYRRFNPLSQSEALLNNQHPSTPQPVHTLVAGFDLQGELLWDNALNFKNNSNTQIHSPLGNVHLSIQPQQMILLQTHNKGINMKVFRGRETIYENKEVPFQKRYEIELSKKSPKIRPYNHVISGWYGDYMLIGGVYNENAHKVFAKSNEKFYLAKVRFVKPTTTNK